MAVEFWTMGRGTSGAGCASDIHYQTKNGRHQLIHTPSRRDSVGDRDRACGERRPRLYGHWQGRLGSGAP